MHLLWLAGEADCVLLTTLPRTPGAADGAALGRDGRGRCREGSARQARPCGDAARPADAGGLRDYRALWRPPHTHGSLSAAACNATVNVTLPSATALTLSSARSTLIPEANPAADIGSLQHTSQLVAGVHFGDGTSQTMTDDSRVTYAVAGWPTACGDVSSSGLLSSSSGCRGSRLRYRYGLPRYPCILKEAGGLVVAEYRGRIPIRYSPVWRVLEQLHRDCGRLISWFSLIGLFPEFCYYATALLKVVIVS